MKRQTKTLIAVLGVFVLLCGALAAVLLTDPGDGVEETSESESESESISLVAREYAELVSVSVKGAGELYAVGTGDATT
ncbi:MAG TPA: hypothetical protein PKY19_08155, partial [Oscillospiraceae bacterium]|nr:hypothetical protein [Oscillospiraceae bacterium]